MIINKLSLLVGGEAGEGISRSGYLFAKSCLRGGLYVFGTTDYQSLIRGGHNFFTVNVDDQEALSQSERANIIIALNKDTILFHKDELEKGGAIIYDKDQITVSPQELERNDIELVHVPMKNIVKDLAELAAVRFKKVYMGVHV